MGIVACAVFVCFFFPVKEAPRRPKQITPDFRSRAVEEQLSHLADVFHSMANIDEQVALLGAAQADLAWLTDEAVVERLPLVTLAFTQSLSRLLDAGGSLSGPASDAEAVAQALSPRLMAARSNFLATAARYCYLLWRIEAILRESQGQGLEGASRVGSFTNLQHAAGH